MYPVKVWLAYATKFFMQPSHFVYSNVKVWGVGWVGLRVQLFCFPTSSMPASLVMTLKA